MADMFFSRRGLLSIFCLCAVVVAAAQTVTSDLLRPLQWRLIGPFRGGRAIAVSGVPGDPNTFYFGAVGGGVWKSTNVGRTWVPVFDSQPVASIGALAVAPSNPNVIYVGTGESDIRSALSTGDGVYKSTDAGKTWRNIGLKESRQISRIVVDPQNPDVVYVGALGHAYGPNPERGVYKSKDGGAHWTQVLNKGPEIGISDLSIAAANPNVLFAGTWTTHRPPWSTYAPLDGPGSGLFRSTDAGQNWTQLTGHGLPDGNWGRVGVAVAPNAQRIYALIEVKKPGPHSPYELADEKKSGLYRSDDGGNSWSLQNNDKRLTGRAWYFDWITIDPSNPDVIYMPNVALYRSEDGGKTVSIVRGAPGGDDYHELWVDPKNPAHLILGTDQGTSVSIDRGATWTTWYNQPTAQMYHVATDNQFPYQVYGAQQDTGSIAVASRSDHNVLDDHESIPVGGGESGYLAIDPMDSNLIYATGGYGSVGRYDRRTSLSQDISPWPMPNFGTEISERKYRAPWTPPLLFSPVDKKTLFLGTQFVMKTTDGGLHWETISPDLTGTVPQTPKESPTPRNAKALGYGVVYTIAPSPLDAQEIWAGSDTGLIHLTTDNGATWKNVTPPGLSDWSKISFIEASHFIAGEAFAAVDRHRLDDMAPYIYRTRDFGKTWQPIVTGIADHSFLRVVREDPRKQGLLYAATESGVYVSFDDGDHWQSLQQNLPVAPVHDLVVHDNDLVIATHGRSFWILDDIAPLRQLSDKVASSNAFLFEPAPATRVDNDSFLGSPLPPEEPTAKNPPDGAVIDYYLKAGGSPVTLEVLDESGNLVRRFSSTDRVTGKHPILPIAERWFPKPQPLENSPGVHRFVWDLRWNASGDKDGLDEDDDYAAPKGPRVLPGHYQVRLTAAGATLTSPLAVTMDPRCVCYAADLQEQLRVGREIFAVTQKSRQAVSEAESILKKLDAAKAKLANNAELLARVNTADANIKKILHGDRSRPAEVTGLDAANKGLLAALRVVEGGNRTIPQQAIELFQKSQQAFSESAPEWQKLKSTELAPLNQELSKAGVLTISLREVEREIEYLMTR